MVITMGQVDLQFWCAGRIVDLRIDLEVIGKRMEVEAVDMDEITWRDREEERTENLITIQRRDGKMVALKGD